MNKNPSRKAQVWFTDFMIGLLIFVIVIYIYYEYAFSISQDPTEITADLLMDAKSISSALITEGSPSNWTNGTVRIIGLTDGSQRVMQEKLDKFANMSYAQIKRTLRTSYDFYFYLEDKGGNRIEINSNQGIGLEPSSYEDMISITRIVIYDSRLVNAVVQVWQS